MENTDTLSAIRQLIASQLIDVNTAINGVIVSYSGGFATVKPTANKLFQDGDSLPYPNLHNVPVRWPVFAGGQAGVKGPVTPGDKVLLVFSQQATDGTDDQRRFDLTDAYAVIVSNEQVSQGANNDDMVMYFGAAYIKLTAGGALEINAPGGHTTVSPTNEFTGGLTNNGVDVGSTHMHSGVTAGGSNTGGPV